MRNPHEIAAKIDLARDLDEQISVEREARGRGLDNTKYIEQLCREAGRAWGRVEEALGVRLRDTKLAVVGRRRTEADHAG